MRYLATSIKANQVLYLDEKFRILGTLAINHARGLVKHGEMIFATGWDDVYQLFRSPEGGYSAYRIGNEGVNNHDVFWDAESDCLWLVNLSQKCLKEMGENRSVICPVNGAFYNTALSIDTWTCLTLKGATKEERSAEFDKVCIEGVIQNTKVLRPHHLAKIRDDWFVCNSGMGQIINARTGELILEKIGFARGLVGISDDEMVFTSTPIRGSRTNKYPCLYRFNPYTKNITYCQPFTEYLDFYQIIPLHDQ